MAIHSVFGAAPPPGSYGLYNDGAPSIKLGNTFYPYAGVTGVTCRGARLWVPAGISLPATVTFEARLDTTDTSNNLDTPPLRTITVPMIAGPAWLEVTWPVFDVANGQVVLISYNFPDAPSSYLYAGSPGNAYIVARDGAAITMTEGILYLPSGATTYRSFYQLGSNAPGNGAGEPLYGVDILVDIPLVRSTVFDESGPPGAYTLFTDGAPSITVGNCFYLYSGVTGAFCSGGRIWLPPGVAVPPRVTIELRRGVTTSSNNLDSPALRSVTVSTAGGPGWVAAYWQTVAVANGEYLMISYRFPDAPASYLYSAATTSDYVYAHDGAPLLLAENPIGGTQYRSYYRIGSGAVNLGINQPFYGIDVIIDRPRTAKVKRWTGEGWRVQTTRVWDGLAWVEHPVYVHDGTQYLKAK